MPPAFPLQPPPQLYGKSDYHSIKEGGWNNLQNFTCFCNLKNREPSDYEQEICEYDYGGDEGWDD